MRINGSRDLGQLIAAARKRRGMSQREVAGALGVSQAWVSRVEQGKQRAWIGHVLRLISFLEIELWGRLPGEKADRRRVTGRSDYPEMNTIVD